jgi:Fe-S oxidoreductase
MAEVMDLCIQCKACKTECPSSVDMAKIKTEWLGHYWKEHRMPLRTRLFAHQPTLAGLIAGTPLAPLVNRVNAAGPVRWLMEKTLGISAERDLPPFARRTFDQWSARQGWIHAGATPPATDAPPVVLFADTFNNAHTPGVAEAAAEVLRATGHAVVVPAQRVCCGRTLLSKGLVARAKATARHAIDTLYPYAAQGWPIAGLEPSCLLTLQDEFLALWPGDPKAEAVADAAVLVETLIADRFDAGTLPATPWSTVPVGGDGYAGPPDDDRPRAVLHGHCHQKALVGTTAAERALALPGTHVDTVDSGCCGMAGAFGYEAEHLDISHKMAERVLAPAVRETPDATCIAAPGFSCRSQIKDTTGRTALHPAQVLQQALQDPQDAGQAAPDKQAAPVGHGEPD